MLLDHIYAVHERVGNAQGSLSAPVGSIKLELRAGSLAPPQRSGIPADAMGPIGAGSLPARAPEASSADLPVRVMAVSGDALSAASMQRPPGLLLALV